MKARCIGLIGGLGVGAAVHYYRELARAHTVRGRVLDVVMVHADVRRVLTAIAAGDRAGLASYLAELIGRLKAAGAEFAVVPAVAPHIAIAELMAQSPLPLVNLIEELRREIASRKLQKVALFGNKYAIESALFGHLEGVKVVIPAPKEVDFIHQTYSQVVDSGVGTASQREALTSLAHTLIGREGVEAIILAGTDLALLFDETNTAFPYLDAARVHLDAILRLACA